MKQKITSIIASLLLLFWLGSTASAGNELPGASEVKVTPVDTSKKEQVPPPQMLTFPLISNICKITFASYTQVRYQYQFDNYPNNTKPTPSSFDIRNARLILKGAPLKNFTYNFQVDFAPPTVRLLDGNGAYTFNKFAKLTAGQQKVPLSYESLRTDYDIHSMSRSQAVEALTARSKDVLATATSTTSVNNNGRDIGLVFSGGVPNTNSTTNSNWVDYSLGVFNGMGINQSDADKIKDFAARAVVHPIHFLSIGGSIYQGKATYGGDKTKPKLRNRLGFDASYEDGKRIYAAVEYLQGLDSASTTSTKSSYGKKDGYYAMLEGYIVPKKFAVLVKYDFWDPNKDVANNETTIYSLALNWYFATFTKFQLQYDYKHEEGRPQTINDLLSAQFQIFF